jgi:hypothetical protein
MAEREEQAAAHWLLLGAWRTISRRSPALGHQFLGRHEEAVGSGEQGLDSDPT